MLEVKLKVKRFNYQPSSLWKTDKDKQKKLKKQQQLNEEKKSRKRKKKKAKRTNSIKESSNSF